MQRLTARTWRARPSVDRHALHGRLDSSAATIWIRGLHLPDELVESKLANPRLQRLGRVEDQLPGWRSSHLRSL